jgi:triosephosphate isomerase
MKRRPLIVGNWKMNLDRAGAVELAEKLVRGAAKAGDLDLAVCPPAVYLDAVSEVIDGSRIALGAQNMYFEKSGAFTGEISAPMLVDLGCRYVILGHSERRHILGETDELVNQKVHAAIAAGLTPIVCVGETLAEREAGRTEEVIRRQFHGSLAELTVDQVLRVVIAYEPVWAIGTGKVATPQQAEEVHVDLRKLLKERYNAAAADTVRIQYGGSVKGDNAAALLACPNIDGALVGGASLKPADFLSIVAAAN